MRAEKKIFASLYLGESGLGIGRVNVTEDILVHFHRKLTPFMNNSLKHLVHPGNYGFPQYFQLFRSAKRERW